MFVYLRHIPFDRFGLFFSLSRESYGIVDKFMEGPFIRAFVGGDSAMMGSKVKYMLLKSFRVKFAIFQISARLDLFWTFPFFKWCGDNCQWWFRKWLVFKNKFFQTPCLFYQKISVIFGFQSIIYAQLFWVTSPPIVPRVGTAVHIISFKNARIFQAKCFFTAPLIEDFLSPSRPSRPESDFYEHSPRFFFSRNMIDASDLSKMWSGF